MSNTASTGYAWQVTIPAPDGSGPERGSGVRPRWGARAWRDGSWQLSVAQTPVPADRYYPVLLIAGPPVDRVTVWILDLVHDGVLTAALDLQLRAGPGTADVGTTEHTLAKGISTLTDNPLFFQGSGVVACEWSLWARTTGLGARTIQCSFGVTGRHSHCCTKGLL